MKKRNQDEVFAAIGAAMRETQGRTLEQIDRQGDAANAAARQLVSITFQDYARSSGAGRSYGPSLGVQPIRREHQHEVNRLLVRCV